ncbi:hypothetical protein ACP70R_046564 [Stipagrostis hirtigluma subsp. patula]
MGKRKLRMSKLAAQPRKPPRLETAFTCPFCNHAGTVECRVDLEHAIAVALCFVCKEEYGTIAPRAHGAHRRLRRVGRRVREGQRARRKAPPPLRRQRRRRRRRLILAWVVSGGLLVAAIGRSGS